MSSWPSPLAGIPAGSPLPSWRLVVFTLAALALVIGLNAIWEKFKGPPNP